jgi:hypothetical protein
LFQEFDFEVVVKLEIFNARLDHLSRISNEEEPNNLEEKFSNTKLFSV